MRAAAGLLQHDLLRTPGFNALFSPIRLDAISHRPLRIPRPFVPDPHDPEAFYYDWPANRTVKKGGLTCDLWRHQAGERVFEFEVLFTKSGEARGVVECTVHAENLTNPQQARLIVRRTMVSLSMTDVANAMVEACN
ncbi:hypothetical protein AU467_10990 [Mesorhizobium loti]|uniref:Uncharacterized protein n=1 Tax=Rhizobium loti TaxID=381 RepID=A0A101KXH2_RHILI|nr:hypothetical protein AU467_10990 [Mesorhizobium loti]